MPNRYFKMRLQTVFRIIRPSGSLLETPVLRDMLARDRRQVMFRSADEAVEAQDMACTVPSPGDVPMDETKYQGLFAVSMRNRVNYYERLDFRNISILDWRATFLTVYWTLELIVEDWRTRRQQIRNYGPKCPHRL